MPPAWNEIKNAVGGHMYEDNILELDQVCFSPCTNLRAGDF